MFIGVSIPIEKCQISLFFIRTRRKRQRRSDPTELTKGMYENVDEKINPLAMSES